MRSNLTNSLIKHLEHKISLSCNAVFQSDSIKSIVGGDINQAYCIQSDNQKFFVKLNATKHLQMFHREAQGLSLLASSNSFKVPRVIAYDSFEEHSFLILQYLDLSGSVQIENFAKTLAKLHQVKQSQYGLKQDNFIGLTPQKNSYCRCWQEFFAQHRLVYQLELLKAKGVNASSLHLVEQVIRSIDAFFIDYQPFPSLLHGDLWQGNYAFDPSGNAIIYDPACYYGDHEADLAMLELFGNPTEAFFAAYHAIFPIDAGYRQRKHLYNLYHILNHANLFGGGYLNQANRMAEQLLQVIA